MTTAGSKARTQAPVSPGTLDRLSGNGAGRGKARPRRPSQLDDVVAWGAVGAVTLFVLWQLHPSLLLENSPPARGDLSGHFRTAELVRHELLPNGRVQGWTQDWFTGYPVLTFYFPLGSIVTALLSFLMPLPVALKLVAASGPLMLPGAAYAFGRLNGRDRLSAACFAVAVLPLLQMEGLLLVGGSISAAAIGEYGYGLALALGIVVLGLARRGHATGRHRALTAGLLAATALFHAIPALMVALGIVVSAVLPPNRAKLRWTASVLAVAFGLVGFWTIPFVLRLHLSDGSQFLRYPVNVETLLPPGLAPVAIVAVFGVVVSGLSAALGVRRLDPLEPFLLLMAGLAVVLMLAIPEGQVLNARFLPIWVFFLCLLAGSLLDRLAHAVDEARKRASRGAPLQTPALARLAMPLALLVVMTPLEDSRLRPGLLEHLEGVSIDRYLEGYASSDRRVEYERFIQLIRRVGREHGCGRAHWEDSEGDLSDFSPTALMPHWTDGCITATQGLYIEASATYPYVKAAAERLSTSNGQESDVERRQFDLGAGAADLRLLGVRYFVSPDPETRAGVEASADFRRIACTETDGARTWCVFEVTDQADLVEPLAAMPVVVPGRGGSRTRWKSMALRWWDDPAARSVWLAADGPSEWPRQAGDGDVPIKPTGPTEVSRVRIDERAISFRVSRPGVPILIKVSYFPNWHTNGATGPWRVSPNHMVVVPTSNDVSLSYRMTSAETSGLALSFAGLVGLGLLAWHGAMSMPAAPPGDVPTSAKQRPVHRRSGRKRRR